MDDDVLRHVDETPRQVAGVRRLQRRVGQALAGAVRRDEVLQHGEAFTEVRRDRRLDDLARRLRHEAAHAGQLANLLFAAAGAGVRHDVDGVELVALAVRRLHPAEHLVGDPLRDVRPDGDDLVVALAVGDRAFEVLLLDADDFLARRRRPAPPSRPGRSGRRCRSTGPTSSRRGSPRSLRLSSILTVSSRPKRR